MCKICSLLNVWCLAVLELWVCVCDEVRRNQCLSVLIVVLHSSSVSRRSSSMFMLLLPRVHWHQFIDGGFPPQQYQAPQRGGRLALPPGVTTMRLARKVADQLRVRRDFTLLIRVEILGVCL